MADLNRYGKESLMFQTTIKDIYCNYWGIDNDPTLRLIVPRFNNTYEWIETVKKSN